MNDYSAAKFKVASLYTTMTDICYIDGEGNIIYKDIWMAIIGDHSL